MLCVTSVNMYRPPFSTVVNFVSGEIQLLIAARSSDRYHCIIITDFKPRENPSLAYVCEETDLRRSRL